LTRALALAGSLIVLACSLASPSPAQQTTARPAKVRRPNILLIVADDLGYGELGCQGHHDVPTPHIDSIARNGVRFTSGYVSCPVCSPTRAGLMTGRYQERFGHEFNPLDDAAPSFGLVRDETTLAERLKAAGYATGMVGKWHLGATPGLRPTERGFDEFFGFLGGAHPYLGDRDRPVNAVVRGTERVVEPTYLTDAFAREALAFIDHHRSEPFFLYLAFNAVHSPLEAPARYRERFAKIKDENRRTFSAMLSAMDDAVGQVQARLREARLEETTLVFFISDNGGPTQQTTSRNDPLRGVKATTWEGGIRIPFLIQWKGHLPAGRVDDRPVISLDIHPTALAAAGIPARFEKPLDGVNLLPFLDNSRAGSPHEYLFWRFGRQMAVRKGEWKLTQGAHAPARRRGQPAAAQLYNLTRDVGESTDLSDEHPDTVKELMDAWEKWDAQLMPPRWGTDNPSPPPRRLARPASR
jgi:arylsulfatase A-like enzyme